jgi:predicted permease
MRSLVRNLWQAGRLAARRPALALAVIGTLGGGFGLAAAIATVVHGLLLRPLPFAEPDRLVLVREVDAAGRQLGASEPTFNDVVARSRSFETLAYTAGSFPLVVTGGRDPVRARVSYASARLFEVLGVRPLTGRTFIEQETRYGGPVASLVTHGFWQRVLGSRADLEASPLVVDGVATRVVGVMPPGLDYPLGTEVWLSTGAEPPANSRRAHALTIIGRLRRGVQPAQAQSELSIVARQLQRELGATSDAVDLAVVSPQAYLTRNVREGLWLLLGAVSLLLLAACANVSNLLLAQFADRRRELAVRRALGATRRVLMCQFTLEYLTLTLPASLLGAALAAGGVELLGALAGDRLPMIDTVAVDARVVGALVLLSIVIAAGLAVSPLAFAKHEPGAADLRSGGRGLSSDRRGRLTRQALLIAQVSVTVVLLAAAGLLGRAFLALLATDPGFTPDHAVAMTIGLPSNVTPQGDDQLRQFYEALLARIAVVPGVQAVGGINALPLTGQGTGGPFTLDREPTQQHVAQYRVASAGYFEAMGIPLRRGRLFDGSDTVGQPHVALVSESLARRIWPGADPMGQRLHISLDTDRRPLIVVGVVGDVRGSGIDSDAQPTIYACAPQRPQWWQVARLSIVVRSTADVTTLGPAMRRAVQALRADVPIELRTMAEVATASLAPRRLTLLLVATFALTALTIAGLGLAAAVAWNVSRRAREIGIRFALGATQAEVLGLVMRDGLAPVMVGLGLGLVSAFTAVTLMGHLVYGGDRFDPLSIGSVALLLLLVAVLACWLPARRVARIDALSAMRAD